MMIWLLPGAIVSVRQVARRYHMTNAEPPLIRRTFKPRLAIGSSKLLHWFGAFPGDDRVRGNWGMAITSGLVQGDRSWYSLGVVDIKTKVMF